MAWIKVEASVRTHEKFLNAGPAACWLWLCGLAYCQEGLTDGFIPFAALNHLGVKAPKNLKAKLVQVGLWHDADGGWSVHGYLKHNKSADVVRAIQDERRTAGAIGGKTERVAKHVASTTLEQSAKHVAKPSTALYGSSTESSTAQRTGARERTAPLIQSPLALRNVAHFSPCGNVPNFIHAELVGKVMNGGAPEGDADKQVRAFYAAVEQQHEGQVVGDEPPKFWRARFAERAKQPKVMSDAAAMVFQTLGVKP